MFKKLVVIKSFQGLVRGDIVSDPAKVREILASDHVRFVRPVSLNVAGKD